MSSNLIRPEIYDNKDDKYGSILLIRPISFSFFTSIVLLIVVFIVLYSYFGSYRSYESLRGVVISSKGVIDITAVKSGVVWSIKTEEGKIVKKGDPLFLVKTEKKLPTGGVDIKILQQLKYEVTLIESQIKEAKDIHEIHISMIEKNIHESTKELSYLKIKNNIHKKSHDSISEDVALYEDSLKKGQVTASQYRDKLYQQQQLEIELLQDVIDISKLQAKITEANNEIQKSKAELSTTLNNLLQKQTEIRKQIINNNSESEYVLESPVDGKVSVLLAKLGLHVNNNDLLLTILPSNSTLQAEFYAPSRSIGFSTVNQEVLVRYDAFPYQKYGLHHGKIVSISETILQPEHVSKSIKITEPVYKILVELDKQYIETGNNKYNLQPGMALDGRFLGQKMKIIEWVLEPMLSLVNNS